VPTKQKSARCWQRGGGRRSKEKRRGVPLVASPLAEVGLYSEQSHTLTDAWQASKPSPRWAIAGISLPATGAPVAQLGAGAMLAASQARAGVPRLRVPTTGLSYLETLLEVPPPQGAVGI
jgi:hypothetical protein